MNNIGKNIVKKFINTRMHKKKYRIFRLISECNKINVFCNDQ